VNSFGYWRSADHEPKEDIRGDTETPKSSTFSGKQKGAEQLRNWRGGP
jgi:hypothetical protein